MKKLLVVLFLFAVAGELRGVSVPRTILVLPFENKSGHADLNWISESFSEVLSARLAGDDRFVLGRRERDAAYVQLGIPAGTPLTLASIYTVADVLGVDWAVTGDFTVDGERLTVHTQTLNVQHLRRTPPLEATGKLVDLVDLETRLAWRLLATQDPNFTVGREEDFEKLFPTIRLDAHENYIRGILATDAESRIRFLGEADRLNPENRHAALELGRYYYQEKDYENAARWLNKLDGNDPNYLEALFMLGVSEFFLGHTVTAEKAFLDLSLQIPLNEVWNNLGFLQARRGRYDESTASFERAYQGDPTDPAFCYNLGAILWQQGKYKDAARYVNEALRLAPDDTEAHRLLGQVLATMGDSAGEQREKTWLAAHDETVSGESTQDVMATLRLKKNYDGRAYRLLSLAVRTAREERLAHEPDSRHAEAHLARGKELLAAGLWREAGRELSEAVSLAPQNDEIRVALAQVYEAQGLHREAAAELETSLKLKDSVAAHLLLARVYLALDRPEAARTQSRAALTLDPDNQEAHALIDRIPAVSPASRRQP